LTPLERLSFLATKIPDITELDINPLMADATGCRAVDARITFLGFEDSRGQGIE